MKTNAQPIADYYFVLLENLINALKTSLENGDLALFRRLLASSQQSGEDAYVEHCEQHGDEPLPKYYAVLFSAIEDAGEQLERGQYRQALLLLYDGVAQSLTIARKG